MSEYKQWIKNADIKIDYFTAFLKAWIGFNAWYNEEIHEDTDRRSIEKICEDSRFKTYVTNLINSDDNEGNTFKNNLAKLHEALNNSPIRSQEYLGVKQDISFSTVLTKNKNSCNHFTFRSIEYKCIQNRGSLQTTVYNTRTRITEFDYVQNEWDIDALKQQTDYINLTREKQSKCENCYRKMVPYITSSVLSFSEDVNKGIQLGAFLFIKNPEKIAEALIQILYLLRCCLAHGDITPDKNTENVYRYAYEVLLIPLKKLL